MSTEVEYPEIAPMTDRGYKTIYADPPWTYRDDLPGGGRGASEHYETMTVDMIAALGHQVNTVAASSAHLWLWSTNNFLPQAYDVVESWGFTPKTVVTWVKVTDEPDSLPHERDHEVSVKERIGMGHYLRNSTEQLIFATKGRKSTNRSDVPTSVFAERAEHSAKPEKFYRLIESLSDGPYLELFARNGRDGWDSWGKEV